MPCVKEKTGAMKRKGVNFHLSNHRRILSRMARASYFPAILKQAPEYFPCSHLRLVRSGYEYFELLESLIHSAKQVIHLQTYIYEDDETGERITKALEEAASRNVKVYLLVDGYASQGLTDEYIKRLQTSGVHFKFFDPLLRSKHFYLGRRLHHKVVTIDDRFAMVGGINISNNYNDTVHDAAWLDWALYVEGEVASALRTICARRVMSAKETKTQSILPQSVKGKYQIRIRINDWVRRKREITLSYLDMLRKANSHVTIMSSYFLPGKEVRRQLSLAAKRGVKIRVVMGKRSDIAMARYAERYMYRWLLRNKIEIYEYLPKILHSKMATCDSQWLTVGSYNVNNISAYASIELNLDLRDPEFVRHVEERLNKIIELDCLLVTEDDYKMHTTLWDQFLQRSAYDIFRFLLFVFTFYFKQRSK